MNELRWYAVSVSCCLLVGCSAGTGGDSDEITSQARRDETSRADPDALSGDQLVVDVARGERAYVSLEGLAVVDVEDPRQSQEWDLALEGWSIFTNSGPSGPGEAAAFGPLDESEYFAGSEPNVPFLQEDQPAGAFDDWYAYDSESHTLWSRHHVYGVVDDGTYYKLQIEGYYGQEQGAPVSAIYSLRYAEVREGDNGPVHEVEALDATAGGRGGDDDSPSGCLDLRTGEVRLLTPTEAHEDEQWHLCFRRDAISVNGGVGGPGDVRAVDLDAKDQDGLEEVRQRGGESELQRFDAIDVDSLRDPEVNYQQDVPMSVFGDAWFDGVGNEATAASAAWYVRAAEGERTYLLLVSDVDGTSAAARRVTLRVRAVLGE